MEKKELLNLLFEVVERLIFPTENKAGEQNPASVIILTFFKKVLEEIKTKETLDVFLHDWNIISKRIKRSLDFPNSHLNNEVELIYHQINHNISLKEIEIKNLQGDDSSLIKIINQDLSVVLQEGLNLQRKWNQNKKNDYDEFFEDQYFNKLKDVLLPGTKKTHSGIYVVNPNTEPCLEFILKTCKSFKLNSNKKKFYPLWCNLREYLFSYFRSEGRFNIFENEWTNLIFEINLMAKKEIDPNNLEKDTGFYKFYNREFDIFYEKMTKTKNLWLEKMD